MLKKHARLFENLLFASDLMVIAGSWVASYIIRFHYGPVPVYKGVPEFAPYGWMLIPIVIIWRFSFRAFGLYRAKRISSRVSEVVDIAKACVVSVLVVIAITFFVRSYEFSRLVFVYFTAINIVFLCASRALFRGVLQLMRKRGYNQRYAVVAGSGPTAREVIEKIEAHPEVGIQVVGYLSGSDADRGRKTAGTVNIGTYEEVRDVVRREGVDIVFIALPWNEHSRAAEILDSIGDEAVDIRMIPDFCEFITLKSGVEDFDGLPIVGIQGSRLYGWNVVLKRAVDVAIAFTALVVFSPLMAVIAGAVRLTSPGPVFFRQARMSIGGDVFEMLKFRTMAVGAESGTGAVWTTSDDPRRTALGAFLRKTSLDELPQLFNVLKGDMSLVGPRPERPVFIREFRKDVPGYMLRHKMKAGITGWAQVNGWRGNTELGKRIEHDIYYIENWSLLFDVKILWLTLWKGFVGRNAY